MVCLEPHIFLGFHGSVISLPSAYILRGVAGGEGREVKPAAWVRQELGTPGVYPGFPYSLLFCLWPSFPGLLCSQLLKLAFHDCALGAEQELWGVHRGDQR